MTKILSFDYILNDISDHKILKIDIELNRIKWGNGYWKINNAYFLDINYQKKIKNTLDEYFDNKINPIEKWELIKNKIKKISKQYSIQQANDRKIYKEVAENLFFDNPNLDPNIKQTIQEKLIEIQNFTNNGNTIRTKNKNLEKIYDIEREINKNEEIKKGNMRNIYKLQNSTGITENQQEILNTANKFLSKFIQISKYKE